MTIPRRLGRSTMERDSGRVGSYTGIVNFTPLRVPLTHTSFDGDAFGDVAATKIENTSWSDDIPAAAVVLIVQIIANDSSGGGGHYFAVGPSAAHPDALAVWPHASDVISENTGPVPCTNGDIWYKVNASGGGTLDCTLKVWGYWI